MTSVTRPALHARNRREISRVSRAALLLSALASQVPAADPSRAEIVDLRKIWDRAPHNAFTDLIRFGDRWFCVFREGQAHVSPDGALRVLTSTDGDTWASTALVTSESADLRDAKITTTPDRRLMLSGAGALHPPAAARHQSFVWFSSDGSHWSDAVAIGDPDFWIWRVTWHGDAAYGIGYATTDPKRIRLYRSHDGRKFEALVSDLHVDGYPNETSLLFLKNDTCLCLLRRDETPNDALLGTSRPPFTDWTWRSLGVRVGGPHVLELPDGRIVAAGRDYVAGAKTRLWWLNADRPALEEIVTLPSSGDTSYPGLVFHDGLLWVSYYSSHEGKTGIYLARIRLPAAS